MYIKFLSWSFVIFGSTLGFLITFLKLYVCRLKNDIVANYVPLIAFVMFFYIIFALLLTIFIKGASNKIIMFAFANSPFIIGKLATYKTEKIFSYLQVVCAFLSVIFVLALMR